jgi:hypothetical protein
MSDLTTSRVQTRRRLLDLPRPSAQQAPTTTASSQVRARPSSRSRLSLVSTRESARARGGKTFAPSWHSSSGPTGVDSCGETTGVLNFEQRARGRPEKVEVGRFIDRAVAAEQ